ncbi:MAG: hypothetical protein WAL94_06725 [Bacteroidales bacterium]
MVTISGYAERESADGKKFYSLLLQGELDLVLSEESGRYYATKKQASITSTFDEATCKALVGKQLPGKIARIKVDPYEYTIKETGEVISLTHRWAYSPNETALDEMIYDKEPEGAVFAL